MKRFLFVSLIILAAVSISFGMDARYTVVNPGTTVFENAPARLILDSAASFMNPVYMLDYKNIVGIDMIVAKESGFVFVEPQVIPGVLGIQVGRVFGLQKSSTLPGGNNIDNINGIVSGHVPAVNDPIVGVGTIGNLSAVRSWGLLYALSLNDNTKVGIAVNSIGNSIEGTNATGDNIKKSIGIFEIRLGGMMNVPSLANFALDLGINLPSYNFERTLKAGGGEKVDFAPLNLDANLRVSKMINDCLEGVLKIEYAHYGGTITADNDTSTSGDGSQVEMDRTRTDFNILFGPVIHNKDSLIGVGLGLGTLSYVQEDKSDASGSSTSKNNDSTFSFPIVQLIGEENIAKWLTVNGSLQYARYRTKNISNSGAAGAPDIETKYAAQSSLDLQLGTVVTLGSFVIEGNMTRDLYFNGPFILTGIFGGNFNVVVSVGYKFGCKK